MNPSVRPVAESVTSPMYAPPESSTLPEKDGQYRFQFLAEASRGVDVHIRFVLGAVHHAVRPDERAGQGRCVERRAGVDGVALADRFDDFLVIQGDDADDCLAVVGRFLHDVVGEVVDRLRKEGFHCGDVVVRHVFCQKVFGEVEEPFVAFCSHIVCIYVEGKLTFYIGLWL